MTRRINRNDPAYEQVPVLVDPKLRNFSHYHPATLVTPNHLEALRMSDTEDTSDDGSLRSDTGGKGRAASAGGSTQSGRPSQSPARNDAAGYRRTRLAQVRD